MKRSQFLYQTKLCNCTLKNEVHLSHRTACLGLSLYYWERQGKKLRPVFKQNYLICVNIDVLFQAIGPDLQLRFFQCKHPVDKAVCTPCSAKDSRINQRYSLQGTRKSFLERWRTLGQLHIIQGGYLQKLLHNSMIVFPWSTVPSTTNKITVVITFGNYVIVENTVWKFLGQWIEMPSLGSKRQKAEEAPWARYRHYT